MSAAGLLLRNREVLDRILVGESAGALCGDCGKPVVCGLFYWLNQHDEPQRASGRVMRYDDWRHVDGTPGHRPVGDDDHGTITPARKVA